jgi:hypothetical protein
MKLIPLLALTLAVAHGAASAQDIPERIWSTSAELGAITTSGNTVGTSITGKIDARQELEDWSNEYIVSGYFKEDETHLDNGDKVRERSAERFSVSAKAAYKLLDDEEKLFVLGSHVDDKFGAYTRYSSLSVGHSSRWFKSPDKSLDVEIGPGYFSGMRATGESENGVTVRGAASAVDADDQPGARHRQPPLASRNGTQHEDQRHHADEGCVQRAQRQQRPGRQEEYRHPDIADASVLVLTAPGEPALHRHGLPGS